MIIDIPSSVGELVDKSTIIHIKTMRIDDPNKLKNVWEESKHLYSLYCKVVSGLDTEIHTALNDLHKKLLAVNEIIWDIEDGIRDCERNKDFGPKFIEFARGVYHNNDERARLKKEINLLLGSVIIEEKSYTDYKSA